MSTIWITSYFLVIMHVSVTSSSSSTPQSASTSTAKLLKHEPLSNSHVSAQKPWIDNVSQHRTWCFYSFFYQNASDITFYSISALVQEFMCASFSTMIPKEIITWNQVMISGKGFSRNVITLSTTSRLPSSSIISERRQKSLLTRISKTWQLTAKQSRCVNSTTDERKYCICVWLLDELSL